MGIAGLPILIGAVAPVAFLFHIVYVRDRYEREPAGLIVRIYLLSLFTVLPALVLEYVGDGFLTASGLDERLSALISAFAVVGLAEEGTKFVFLRRLAERRPEFTEPYDGVLYAVCVGLGFATVENIAYVFRAPDLTGQLALVLGRGFTSVPVHTFLAVLMGWHIGRARFITDHEQRERLVWGGMLVPAFLHGLYDFPLLLLDTEWGVRYENVLVLMAAAVLVLLWVLGFHYLRRAQQLSPIRPPA